MALRKTLIVAALLSATAAPGWAGDSKPEPPSATQAVQEKAQAAGEEMSQRQKRREAQRRLRKAIEERAARKTVPPGEVALPGAAKGGTQ